MSFDSALRNALARDVSRSYVFWGVVGALWLSAIYTGYVVGGWPMAAAMGAITVVSTALVVASLLLIKRTAHAVTERFPWTSSAGLVAFWVLFVAGQIWLWGFSQDKQAIALRRSLIEAVGWFAALGFVALNGVGELLSFMLTVRGLLIVIALLLYLVLQQLVRLNR